EESSQAVSLGLEFLEFCGPPSRQSWRYTCSPQRKLWVQIQAKPQALVSGRHICFHRQTYSGTLDLFRLKFREGTTHISIPLRWGLSACLISHPQLALWASGRLASFSGSGQSPVWPSSHADESVVD